MSAAWITPLILIGLAYQAYVTRRAIMQPGSTGVRQVLQIGLIWFLPVVGALVVHAFLKWSRHPGES